MCPNVVDEMKLAWLAIISVESMSRESKKCHETKFIFIFFQVKLSKAGMKELPP